MQQDTNSLAALEKLQAQGAASANEVAQAQHQLTAAQAKVNELQAPKGARYSADDLRAQRALVAQAQAGVDAAQSAYAGVDIHAPFAGTVYAIPVTQYQFVQGGETLVQVANLKKLQIRAYFDEPEIGQLKVGSASDDRMAGETERGLARTYRGGSDHDHHVRRNTQRGRVPDQRG